MSNPSWVWDKGDDPRALIARLQVREAGIMQAAAEIIERTVEEGAGIMQDNLEAATTPTGERRQARRGGFPGRHESGNMVGSIGYGQEREGNVFRGWWGWSPEELEAYFLEQEYGKDRIPAAHSLVDSFAVVSIKFRTRVKAFVNRGKVQ